MNDPSLIVEEGLVRPNQFHSRPGMSRQDSEMFEMENIYEKPDKADHELNVVNITVNTYDITADLDQVKEPMTSRNPPKNMWRIATACCWMLVSGSADAIPGAILPEVEKYYGLSYSLVSLIWLGNAIGFILVASCSHMLEEWLSLDVALIAGTFFSIAMYAIVSSGTKFPVIVIGFVLGGIGAATVLSKVNVFLARFGDKLSKYLSITQSFYGLGATISPIIATLMMGAGVQWHYVYLVLLGLMVVTSVTFYFAYRGCTEDMAPFEVPEENISKAPTLRLALKNKVTWIIALFVFFYQGSEVSMGGWIVTYLLDYRKGTQVVGYVASGFWGGVGLGRLLLARPLHKAVGARRSVTICTVLSLVLVALTWAVPTVVAAGVFVSLTGFFVGPNYPIMISLAADLLPRKIQIVSLTIATAFGSAGGAFFPFLVGLVSQSVGTYVVLPAFLILYSVMLGLWLCLPNRERDGNFWQKLF